jgi:hypothetical protein
MKCPHCNIAIYNGFAAVAAISLPVVTDRGNQPVAPSFSWAILHQRCPECHESIIRLQRTVATGWADWKHTDFIAYPRSATRPIAKEVPEPYRQDFSEACKVLADSPKASAALSRRCLQAILKDQLGAKKKDLNDQIEEVVASGKLPSYIAEGLHAVRNIGNFAAHPLKSTTSGAIVDVEPEEADWNLDVLESLFDFCFVAPAADAKRKAELNKKLTAAGKPPIP